MDINKAFHLYDIRGDYPQVVDEQLAGLVTYEVSNCLGAKKISLAWDNRNSSVRLVKAIEASSENIELIKYGEIPTPIFYFGTIKDQCDAGIMVTASHLPNNQNGFKIVKKMAVPLSQEELNIIKKETEKDKDNLHTPFEARRADENRFDITQKYIEEITSFFNNKPLFSGKIVIDTGKTILTPAVSAVFTRLKINYVLITPNRGPNPLMEENRSALYRAIETEKADLGIIWDGDGDRVIFVDSYKRLIPPAFILGILAKNYNKAVFDVRAGRAAYTTDYRITASWAQEIKFMMEEDPKVMFGGETSGHIVFREWYCIDDGIFASIKFLETIANTNLNDLILKMRLKYTESPEINYQLVFEPAIVLQFIADYYRSKGDIVSLIDGVTVTGDNYKFNLRQSLTEPYIRLNLETQNEEGLGDITHQINSLINHAIYNNQEQIGTGTS